MPFSAPYVLIASMDVALEHERLFNEIYDEHAAHLASVPGVRKVTRMKGQPFRIRIGGELVPMPEPDPIYTAIYEIDDPKVLESEAWAEACEAGRWASEIRQHTRNRKHHIYKISPSEREFSILHTITY
ncbi:hypothetical protein FQV39_32715 (plasmid) [Bosea sp. F3-2]|uniref:hypothetical protein n=1 Tax=Bosea sp. F3-2 TaxID=2599640 RepID=UPI0011ED5C41|nr:hypothetical protein [Bosea sp. F3-2]QEL27370.1 hypothetical protein FQV39_32715 [Bosea sp. F3-2]